VLPSPEVKQTLLDHDSHSRAALRRLDEVHFALTGIGAVGSTPPLRAGDNFFTATQIAGQEAGAVGELNLRYITEDGDPLNVDIEDLVVGATLEQLGRADRRLGAAGGPPKKPRDQSSPGRRAAQHARHRPNNRTMAPRASRLTCTQLIPQAARSTLSHEATDRRRRYRRPMPTGHPQQTGNAATATGRTHTADSSWDCNQTPTDPLQTQRHEQCGRGLGKQSDPEFEDAP
jgi:hypothetical protein